MEPLERCDLCALPIASEHPHLFDRERRSITCACHPCATLFEVIEGRRYRRIQPAVRRLAGMTLDDAAWTSLGIPVGLAYLAPLSNGDIVAACPGPAGPATSRVDPAAWSAVVAQQPGLSNLEPDVEAWLVNRIGPESRYYRVSIDHCYRLAGLVRSRWNGVGGGPAVAATIAEFFQALERQAA